MQKELRLKRREDYNKVYRHGKSVANFQFVLYCRKQPAAAPFRLGISVSKKVGTAVVRNRIRRRVKEIVRHHAQDIAHGNEYILIARKPVAEMEYSEMEKSIIHVMKRAGVWKKSREGKM
jgi:ribonuclease P protein component